MSAGAGALPGAANRIITRDFDGRWDELEAMELPGAAAVLVRDNHDAARAVWAAATAGSEVLVASRTRVTPDLAVALLDAGLAIVDGADVTAPAHPRPATPGRVWLLTSGGTGRPKQVAHTLTSLTTVAGDQPRRTWLCPYAHGAYAWWQIVT